MLAVRVLVLNTNYLWSLGLIYRRNPELATATFGEQRRVLEESFTGEAASYARAFSELGHDSTPVDANNAPAQVAWAREHGESELGDAVLRPRLGLAPRELARWLVDRRTLPAAVLRATRVPGPLLRIVLAQVAAFRPDVVLNQDLFFVDRETLREIKRLGARVVGQHAASALPAESPVDEYDLLVSSFPPTVHAFRARGLNAQFNGLAFDPRVLERLGPVGEPEWAVTFVGSLQRVHSSRVAFLEELAALVPDLRIWTHDASALSARSPLRRRIAGQVTGIEMYELLRSSGITLNHHGDVAPFANNLRLFEATGVGTLLLTDAKPNLADLFEPGREVLAYSSPAECAELIHALARDERDQIAVAGQRKTLEAHTYRARVSELVAYFERL